MSGGHAAVEGANKRIGLFIAVLALLLAIAETGAKSGQTGALAANVDAANLWAFFQAKTIRASLVRTAAEGLEAERAGLADSATRQAFDARIAGWRQMAERYESEPETQEGRKELAARAKAMETRRDLALARYHHYEFASAAFQIAIVLASATIITGAGILLWLAGGLGLAGIAFSGIGFLAPNAVHLL